MLTKKLKLGLVGASICLAAALPAYANSEKPVETVEKVEIVQPINVDNINTLEQIDVFYKKTESEYASDKFLNFKELENLYKIEQKREKLLEKEKSGLSEQYAAAEKTEKEIEIIDSKLKDAMDKHNGIKQIKIFDIVNEEFSEKVLKYYPALFSDDLNVVYSAEAMLEPELNSPFKEIVVEADKILKKYHKDDSLEILVNKTEYNINHILTLHKIIEEKNDYFDEDNKEKLKEKIEDLKGKKSEIINSNVALLSLKSNLENLDKRISKVDSHIKNYERYFEHKKTLEEFEAKYGNFNRKIFVSALARDILSANGISDGGNIENQAKLFGKIEKNTIFALTSNFLNYGPDIKIEKLGNPAKPMVPFAIGFFLALGLPVIRNLLLKRYLKPDLDDTEYLFSGIAGLGNGMIGALFDYAAPWIFPVRMLTPLVLQPTFKLLGVDPCGWCADEL